MLEVRERRGRFGRVVKWALWIFQLAMMLLSLGTCVAITPYMAGPDPEVALGAGMFGAMAIGTLWALWPIGTLMLACCCWRRVGGSASSRPRRTGPPSPPDLPPGVPAASLRPAHAADPQWMMRRRLTEAGCEATFRTMRGPCAIHRGYSPGGRAVTTQANSDAANSGEARHAASDADREREDQHGRGRGRTLLVELLRERLRLTGTHVGCDTSQCGACIGPGRRRVGEELHHAGGAGRRRAVTTIEGLAKPTAPCTRCRRPSTIPRACNAASARPGMVMSRHRPGADAPGRADRGRDPRRGWRATSAAAPATTTSSRRSPRRA